jgi:hypothetical protein
MANPIDPLLRVIADEYIDKADLDRFTSHLFRVISLARRARASRPHAAAAAPPALPPPRPAASMSPPPCCCLRRPPAPPPPTGP